MSSDITAPWRDLQAAAERFARAYADLWQRWGAEVSANLLAANERNREIRRRAALDRIAERERERAEIIRATEPQP